MHEAFLEDINSLLNTGSVPNLHAPDEKVQVLDDLEHKARMKGFHTTSEIWDFFINSCRLNLHVVLCLSPHSPTFRNWLRKFPSLVNCCYVDWFDPWPAEALRSVASLLLKQHQPRLIASGDADAGGDGNGDEGAGSGGEAKGSEHEHEGKEAKHDDAAPAMSAEDAEIAAAMADLEDGMVDNLVDVCVGMQMQAVGMAADYKEQLGRTFHVTPTTYLELVNTFKRLFAEKRNDVRTQLQRYQNGVQQILTTEQKVAVMRQELISLQPVLEQSRKDTAALMADIEVQQQQADATREVVEAEEEECARQAAAAKVIRDECESELAQALPALKSAVQALKTLTKSDIVVVKSMRKPPPGVRLVLETVCIVLKVKPVKNQKGERDYWLAAQKSLLNDTRFVKRLRTFNKDKMTAAVAKKLQPYIENPEFQPETIKFASTAAEGMCKWVRAMVSYHHTAKDVEPKKKALDAANAELQQAQVWIAPSLGCLLQLPWSPTYVCGCVRVCVCVCWVVPRATASARRQEAAPCGRDGVA